MENMLTHLVQAQTPGKKLLGKIAPFEKFQSAVKDEAGSGGGTMKKEPKRAEKSRKEFPANHIAIWFDQS